MVSKFFTLIFGKKVLVYDASKKVRGSTSDPSLFMVREELGGGIRYSVARSTVLSTNRSYLLLIFYN